tara:strand:+ start:102 stop:362 length:261 start_codon:yes stop_codon:yes gene_type:complete
MIKVALVVTIISISNPEKAPDITIPVYYNNIQECNDQLDFLKKTVNAEELLDNEKNRMLRMRNREYHHQSYIFWSCEETKKKIDSN